MSGFGSRLTHTVTIEREVDSGLLDDYGHPISAPTVLDTVKAAIQPLTEREVALISQGGPAISDHRIYLFPTDLTTADSIVHDEDDCPVASDLPSARYEVTGVPNAAGLGHHLEVEARLVSSPQEAEGS